MPDYNIFIHATGTSNSFSKIKPWGNQEEDSADAPFTVAKSVTKNAGQFISSGFTQYAETGVSSLARIAPAVAIAVAAVKVTDKILTTGFSHLETYTGHYEYSMNFNNFKTAIGNFLNPIGTMMKYVRRQNQFDLQNKRVEQERTLVGNSILNLSVKGV